MFDWILSVMSQAGYAGLAFLMLIENVFPPIPSEVVVPLGGFLAARGSFSLPLVIIVATAGSVAGATFWYWVGIVVGEARLRAFAARYGRWLTISPGDVDRASAWFREKGAWAVLVGRMMPGFRTLISVPAGVARMPLGPFLIYTTAGSLVWIGGLAILGYVLESQYERVGDWIDPASWIVLGAVVGIYLWRLFRQEVRS
ncbi:DedA family protein [Jannaschia seohaensis]|uniref:Membrane protein DedA with SNARE-associated domain n=1 Tax=Jannaschia seohaensis TaxID=475081 RepID=A0A2Y9ATT8_9RHOB|nr:DedA family protein [Jannaschia seohaensis]PWJ17433.1 membrane protein DedA with SNARE-associated domain [Jannaschia seohaensis]SSA47496.1 membrane protein DedA, SNARE-associated domain [Jannaschia seohaensis]